MWAQNWGNIFDVVTPFPGKKTLDVTPAMIAQVSTTMVKVVVDVINAQRGALARFPITPLKC